MIIKTKWEYGDIVFLKTDPEQNEYILTGIIGRPGGIILKVSHCGAEVEVYEFETSKERNILQSMGVNLEEE